MMNTVLTFFLNLRDGLPPKLEKAGDSVFIEQVKSRMASYLSLTPVGAAGSGAVAVLYGEAAAKQMYDALSAAFAADPKAAAHNSDISRLQCYHWLLTSDQLAALRKIATTSMARASHEAATRARKGRKTAASTDAQAAVASLFVRR